MKKIIKKYCFVIVTLTSFALVLMQYSEQEDEVDDEIYDPGPMEEYGWNI
jgi:hypothetical protein